jgi:hypothetical protein
MWLVRRQEHRLGGVSTQRLAGNRDIRFALEIARIVVES